MAENNESTLDKASDFELKVAINSIQRTLHVERLHVNPYRALNYIIPYDFDNLYPNKIKNIAKRSGTTMSSIGTLSSFISGSGFLGMNTEVNRSGQTWWDILRFVSFQKAMFNGFALHVNYNIFGQIAEINPINFEFVRWSSNLQTFIVNPDWARRKMQKDEVEYLPFNPEAALDQMAACGGLEHYKGQLMYFIPQSEDWYTTCYWDSVIDDAQFEAEAKLYSLSSIQNDYSLSGFVIYPKNLSDKKEIDDIKDDLRKDTGAGAAGGIRVVGAMPTENMNNWNWFTPISRNSIDNLHKNQKEDAKFNIYAAFRQPPILNGVATSGMFNEASFKDAFNYYNASTQTEREEVESILNKILPFTIWGESLKSIKINPKVYATSESGAALDGSAVDVNKEAQATLKGSVGGVQGILEIQRAVSQGLSDYGAALEILKEIFGFTEEKARAILGTPITTTTQ